MKQFELYNPNGSKTHVNGKPVPKGATIVLAPDDRIIFGSSNVFRLYVPKLSRSITGDDGHHENNGLETSRKGETKESKTQESKNEQKQGHAEEGKQYEGKQQDQQGKTKLQVEISWHYAMEELNEQQMAAFKEEHSAEREASEKLRLKMENRLKEMELQIKHERASGGARAAELEAQLTEERSRAESLQRRKAKEAEMRSLMDQKLLKTIGLVEEANSIAIELQKGKTKICLKSITLQTDKQTQKSVH